MTILKATPAAVAALAAAVAVSLSTVVVVGRVGGRGGLRAVRRAAVATAGYGEMLLRKTDWVMKASSYVYRYMSAMKTEALQPMMIPQCCRYAASPKVKNVLWRRKASRLQRVCWSTHVYLPPVFVKP